MTGAIRRGKPVRVPEMRNLPDVNGRLFILPPEQRRLLALALRDGDILPHLQATVEELGFNGFSWTFSPVARELPEAPLYRFHLMPPAWIRLYDERGYRNIDTRIQRAMEVRLPIAWDQKSERGRSRAMDALLDDALAYGMGSGVMYPVAEINANGIVAAFTQPQPILDQRRLAEIEESLPRMIAFTRYLTDGPMRPVIESLSRARIERVPLTEREREVLGRVAGGESVKTIANVLAIAERTVQAHVNRAREKLAAHSRDEAVATAVRHALILNNLPRSNA